MPTTVAIAGADDTTTMSIQSRFADGEGMERMIEMGMEQVWSKLRPDRHALRWREGVSAVHEIVVATFVSF
jgi:hypothetical protein